MLVALVLLAGCRQPVHQVVPRNVIFLLVDDWGWRDAGCYGSDFYATPNIDRLAGQSVRFSNAYSACTVCSPSRAAILTGMYPARLHVTDWIPGQDAKPDSRLLLPDWTMKLEHRHVTLAEVLQSNGYRTGHVGKWHLMPTGQPDLDDYTPTRHGFDVNVGGNQWGEPGSYFHPYRRRRLEVRPLPSGGKEGDYLTDRLTDEALKLIDGWADQPFFLYFPYYTLHTPLQARAELEEAHQKRLRPGLRHSNATYAAMIQSLDESVGRLLARLEELEIADRTIIFLTGDNGGLEVGAAPTDNAPLRAGKGSVYEGGVRVPTIIKWPGVTPTGLMSDTAIMSIDYYPTILEMLNLQGSPAHDENVDGVSLVPVLKDPRADLGRTTLFWHYPHYHDGGATPYGAIREKDWKLIEFYEEDRVELYDLKADVGETTDLSASRPRVASRLRDRLRAWRASVDAQMPIFNPESQGLFGHQ